MAKDKIRLLSSEKDPFIHAKFLSKAVSVLAQVTSEGKEMVDNGKLKWGDFKKIVCCTCP